MSFDEIRKHQENRRMNILKGFSDFDESMLQKSENTDGEDSLEKAKQYADNYQNKKLNRVGQTYGKDKEETPNQEKQASNTDEANPNKANPAGDQAPQNTNNPNVPEESQPNQEGQYSTDELMGFAQEAEDWQLQEFINDASKSGDNSEYMQAQINIAQDELNRRARPTSDIGEGADVDANDLNNANQEQDGQEENTGEVDYSNADSVKNYLMSNPEAKEAVVNMMMEDVMLSPAQALRIHQAQTTSGGEALQHVEQAKQVLDELHAKLGGSPDSGNKGGYEFPEEQERLMREVLGDGSDYNGADDFLSYLRDEDEGVNDFAGLPDEAIIQFYNDNMSDEANANREEMNQNRNWEEEEDERPIDKDWWESQKQRTEQSQNTIKDNKKDKDSNEAKSKKNVEDGEDGDLSSKRPDRDDFENDDINLDNASMDDIIDWLDYQDENGGPEPEDEHIYKEALKRLDEARNG